MNIADLDEWRAQCGAANLPSGNPYLVGDANLDGTVDGQDFIVWNDHKFTNTAAWCSGDFTADGVVDAQDFIEWNRARIRETYRPRASAAKNNQDLAEIVSEMLDQLEDLHVYVEVDGRYVPGYNRDRSLNANANATAVLIGSLTPVGSDLRWGRTSDRIGYIDIRQLVDPGLPDAFDGVLGQMGDTKGLVLDLRWNGGGSEPLGQQIAGRFLDRRRIYSISQYRSGPRHADLGPKNPRACEPDGPWHYRGPVVVLQGQKTMSSAESFALMLAQCPQVITLGDRTAGSSANPRRVDAGAGIVVNLPQWIDMDPQGKPIDVVGIPPRVKITIKIMNRRHAIP